MRPLKGLQILDLSRLLPGPFCTYLLSQLGARLTAIIPPHDKEVLSFPLLHQKKKKIVLDLKTSQGLAKVKKLLKTHDVVVEGFRPGVLARLGLPFSELKKHNPHLILCSLSGYGQKDTERAGHDLNYLAESGFLSALHPFATMQIPGIPLGDLIGGFTGAFKILAALSIPKKKRKALWIDLSITDAIKALLYPLDPQIQKIVRPIFQGTWPRYHLYQTQDSKFLAVACLEEKFWEKFVKKMNIPNDLLGNNLQVVNWLEKIFAQKTQKDWLSILKDPDLCVSGVIQ